MLLLLLGIALLTLKYLELTAVATWPWWTVLSPFGAAVVWWWWADATGYTKRRAVDKENARKKARIDKSRQNLGLQPRSKR